MSELNAPVKNPELNDPEIKKIDAGFLGKFFGMGDHCSKNVAGLIVIVLIVFSCIIFFTEEEKSNVWNFIKSFSPVITLALGYLFGKAT